MTDQYSSLDLLVERQVKSGIEKVSFSTNQLIIYSILAGLYISIGAAASAVIYTLTVDINAGSAKILSALVFCIGIILVVIGGASLFTGNILLVMPFVAGKVKLSEIIKNWLIVWFFNFIGAVLFSLLVSRSDIFFDQVSSYLVHLAEQKASLDFYTAFLRGVGCNILVCLSIWIASASDTTTSKILSASIPVSIFVILGFEHCVANMFYFPTALLSGANISFAAMLSNLIPVTLGNIVGGAIIGLAYFYSANYARVSKYRSA
ncbi:MAG: formate/nitrite transporter family protein [Tissierellia bacterium]|nr:formate/nitrite transporter family protein [Tissierellia bacterium]